MRHKIDQKLLDIVVCPNDKAPLEIDNDANQLVCTECNKRYNIAESGIPIFLSPKPKNKNRSIGDN